MVIYYLTTRCNFNCAYCEDFGALRNAAQPAHLPLEQVQALLQRIRSGVDSLWLTGGEPLLAPTLEKVLEYARRELRFRFLSLITNGSLLLFHPHILPWLDRLVISLDSLDPQAAAALNMPAAYPETLREVVRQTARRQKADGFQLVLNAVITPQTLQPTLLEELLDFCAQNEVWISFSPQSVNNWPRYELLTSPEYRVFVQTLLRRKKQGARILGSWAYLKTILDFQPFDCYPSLAPRVLPGGELEYPCRPIAKAGGEQGGRAIHLLDFPNWQSAWQAALKRYGPPPLACNSCFQQCYAEPSLLYARPWLAWTEPANLGRFTPG